MDEEIKQKIAHYADKAYAFASHTLAQQTIEQVVNMQANLASKGLACSSVMVREMVKIRGSQINTLVQAKANALMDAYELYGIQLDHSVLHQAEAVRWQLIEETVKKPSTLLPPNCPGSEMLERLLVQETGGITSAVECQIEQRKIMPKFKKPENIPSVQNIYHLHGNNSRVNVQSTDQSVNIVNLTSEQLFLQLRQLLKENSTGESQSLILDKLNALEKAQNTPTFAQRYTEFISAAADYVTLLSPFIPALTELLQKTLA